MKAIKVLFAVILTATLGLVTSCGGGGGGGGGGGSSDFAPDSIVGKTMTIIGYSQTTQQPVTQTFEFTTNSTVNFTNTVGIIHPCKYTYQKYSSEKAQIVVSYNYDGEKLNSDFFQYTYLLNFTAKDEALANYSRMSGKIDINGNKTNTETYQQNYNVTLR